MMPHISILVSLSVCLCGLLVGCQGQLAREAKNETKILPSGQSSPSFSKNQTNLNATVAAELKKAYQFADDDKLEQALSQIDRVLKMQTNHLPALMARSRVLMRMNRARDAEQSIRQVLQLEPGNMDAKLILGYCYLDQKQWKTAENCLTEVANSEGTVRQRVSAYLGLASIYENQDQKELMSTCYREAMDLDESVAEILMQAERQFFWPKPIISDDERSSRPSPSVREIERIINDVKKNPQ